MLIVISSGIGSKTLADQSSGGVARIVIALWEKGSNLGMESRRMKQRSRASGPRSKIGHVVSHTQLPPGPVPVSNPGLASRIAVIPRNVLPTGAGFVQGKGAFPRLFSA